MPFYTFFLSSALILATSSAWSQSIDVPRDNWKVQSVDSAHSSTTGEKAFDGDETTHWHTKWGAESPLPPLPHNIQIDLGGEYEVNGFHYLPRPDGGNGNIKGYEFHVSRDGKDWGKAVASGCFENRNKLNKISFEGVPHVRFVKLVAQSGFSKNPSYAAVAELYVMQKSDALPEIDFSIPSRTVKTGHKLHFGDQTRFSPISWEWTFPGGTPDKSTEQTPVITYNTPGQYAVTLKVKNRNGASEKIQPSYITVTDHVPNLALCLDGQDNDVRTGMKLLTGAWTLEAWIKGNDTSWNAEEVIFGGGEYGNLKNADSKVLTLKKGKLSSTKAGLACDTPLDDKWHHVAVSCDGKITRLFLDGKKVAQADKAVVALPSCIGIDRSNSTFGGLIDEVRFWESAVPQETIQSWMNKPLTPGHPAFKSLAGYYPFDDMTEETSVNWVGKGHQAYHIRNGRLNFRGQAPVAYTVTNENPAFTVPAQKQELFNAVVIPSEWDADRGTRDDQILKLRIAVNGDREPLKLSEIQLDLSQTTDLKDIDKVHVYYTGNTAKSDKRQELFGSGQNPRKNMTFRANSDQEAQPLAPGINYFLVTFDVSKNAKPGNILKATVPSFKGDSAVFTPEADTTCVDKFVTRHSNDDPNTLKVLQWNIWNGGVHLAHVGRERIIDLIKATRADVVTMQEGYGAQEQIAQALGYKLQTASSGDNLALFSHLPMQKITTKKTFNSNPAIVTMKNGCKVLVNDIWFRYAYRPQYTCVYMNDGLNPEGWIAEDAELPVEDAKYILNTDVYPHLSSQDMPSIVGGDFNSGSHLDWTAAAASFHNGYGPVALPTSKYMQEQGYKDSFREINPDEVARPDGTYAAVYGHLQHSRMDFLYYKGTGIKAVASKIVRTPPEIDYVWPSDHAGVLTVFEVEPEPQAISDK